MRPVVTRPHVGGVPSTYSVRLVRLNFRPASSRMASMLTLILTGLLVALRTRRALALENLALRHQLAVLQRAAPRPRLRRSDRLFWVLLSRLWRGWAEVVVIVQPETVLRWHRAGFTRYWTWKSRRRGPGHPAVASDVRALIRRMSEANLSFAKTPSGGQVVDLSALIRRQSRLDDHPPAPPASTPPVPLRRPPPARPREPRLAPAARRVQENGDPAEAAHDAIGSSGSGWPGCGPAGGRPS